jgi:hypothetical protein
MNQFTTSRDFYIGVFTQSGPIAAIHDHLGNPTFVKDLLPAGIVVVGAQSSVLA